LCIGKPKHWRYISCLWQKDN